MTKPKPGSTHPRWGSRKIELAEWMAEHGGTVPQAAKALGWPYENAKQVWMRVRNNLGPQAR